MPQAAGYARCPQEASHFTDLGLVTTCQPINALCLRHPAQ